MTVPRRMGTRAPRADSAWVMREMQSPEGGYYSSLDADSEHVEGKFYVWSMQEIQDILGEMGLSFGMDVSRYLENRTPINVEG